MKTKVLRNHGLIPGTITPKKARKMAINLGERLTDAANAKGAALTLDEVKDVFKQTVPKRLIPKITADAADFEKACQHLAIPEDQKNTALEFMGACYFLNNDSKGHSIYLPKKFFESHPIVQVAGLSHEFFHTLSKGKTAQGKKGLKNIREAMQAQQLNNQEPINTNIGDATDVQKLLMNAFRVGEMASPSEEFVKLHGQLQRGKNPNRVNAYIRTVIRTVFDPRLKEGGQKEISKLSLIKEKSVNPEGIAIRPTKNDIENLRALFKEESQAYHVSGQIERYGLGVSKDTPVVTTSQVIAGIFAKAPRALLGEKNILNRNS